MTTRYVTLARPRGVAFDEYFEAPQVSIEVIEQDHAPVDTGLLDASGNKLFRVEERRPIGFAVDR